MARQYIGYTPRGATVLRNVRKDGGYPLLILEEEETRKITLDFAALLESGETVSSAAVSATGVTASIATSGSSSTLTLSSPSAWGEATVTVTLSSGEIIAQKIRCRTNAAGYDPTEVAYAL